MLFIPYPFHNYFLIMEELKDRFISKMVFRYLFHFLFLILFAFSFVQYLSLQDFIVKTLSKIKYKEIYADGQSLFMTVVFFVALCYSADYRILKRVKLNEYFIPFLLFSDILCLFLTNLLLIYCSNLTFERYAWPNAGSINDYLIICVVICLTLKNRAIENYLKKINIISY